MLAEDALPKSGVAAADSTSGHREGIQARIELRPIRGTKLPKGEVGRDPGDAFGRALDHDSFADHLVAEAPVILLAEAVEGSEFGAFFAGPSNPVGHHCVPNAGPALMGEHSDGGDAGALQQGGTSRTSQIEDIERTFDSPFMLGDEPAMGLGDEIAFLDGVAIVVGNRDDVEKPFMVGRLEWTDGHLGHAQRIPSGTLRRMPVRVRFAPSPTGMLHVGALRDALFKFLFAHHEGGANILRIEDTDRTRYNPDSEQEFVDTLRWVGIVFDEGPHIGGPHAPYRQSERKEAGIYARWIDVLIEKGHAYRAYDTPEELDQMREFQQINKMATGYFGGDWRDATPDKVAAADAAGKPFVIRQRIPRNTTIAIDDLVRGKIEWDSNLIDDPVLIKADGMPTYHFAAMVDDHLMGITHIIRGEEWISSAPKHAALFDAFGWERPVFVHCPVIVGVDGKKLSKRHGATRVLDYAAQGYLPSGLKNFIALIGWSPGEDREVLTEAELIDSFELARLQPSPGRFDLEKLKWLNGAHIRLLEPTELLDRLLAYTNDDYTRAYWEAYVEENPMPGKAPFDGPGLVKKLDRICTFPDRSYLLEAVKLEQERVQTLADFGEALEFFLVDVPVMDAKAEAKWLTQGHVPALLETLLGRSEAVPTTLEAAAAFWDETLRSFQTEQGFEKLGPVVHPTRVVLTGKTFGPGLFELMAVLGPERIRRRVAAQMAVRFRS